MSKPTAALRRALKLADVQVDRDFSRGWYFQLGTSDDYYTTEISAMIGAVAELTRKDIIIRTAMAEKKKPKKR